MQWRIKTELTRSCQGFEVMNTLATSDRQGPLPRCRQTGRAGGGSGELPANAPEIQLHLFNHRWGMAQSSSIHPQISYSSIYL